MADIKSFQNNKIKIDTGIREIEVNDNGDTIKIRTADTAFQNKIFELTAWVQAQKDGYERLNDELSTNIGNTDRFLEILHEINAVPEQAAARIDGLFGAGSCMKIFGTTTPDILLVLDFLNQLLPIFEDAMADRAKQRTAEIKNKYNIKRGNV